MELLAPPFKSKPFLRYNSLHHLGMYMRCKGVSKWILDPVSHVKASQEEAVATVQDISGPAPGHVSPKSMATILTLV